MKLIHYSRTGYNGDFTHTAICGKKVKSHQDNEETTVDPEKANCKKCLATHEFKIDLGHSSGETHTRIKRRIFLESDILHADEFQNVQREVFDLLRDKRLKMVDRIFSEVLDYAWHDLEKTWVSVKKADEIYADSSLLPLSGGSYMGAPVIFNGMCERAIKEGISGKDVYILRKIKNILWHMIDFKLMKETFKNNNLFMYDANGRMVKVDVSTIKK